MTWGQHKKKIQPKYVGKGIVGVCQGVYINIMGLFPPSWILWCLKHLLAFIICNLSSFLIWINLHVCPSFVFMTLHILLFWKRPPNCKLQVPQALTPALARGHAVSLPHTPECSFPPHISRFVTFPLGAHEGVVEHPDRVFWPSQCARRCHLCDNLWQFCSVSLDWGTTSLHQGWPRTERDRDTNAPSSYLKVQLWRCGLWARVSPHGPGRGEILPHTPALTLAFPAPGSLTFYRFFLNQSWASKSSAHCISRLWQSPSLLLTGI